MKNHAQTSLACITIVLLSVVPSSAAASYHFGDYTAQPPLHIYATTGKVPKGMTPEEIKKLYGLPAAGGKGTIAIIGAYNDAAIEQDLADFDAQFHLPACTIKNGCLTQHLMSPTEGQATGGWQMETALDVEWVHAIAPGAKILLVEATTPSGANLLNAIDYIAKQKDIKAVSMSWGGAEFPEETTLDKHFTSVSKAVFVASSGDSGAGVSWPAASPKVLAVGGTSLGYASSTASVEVASPGSGGGVSEYEKASTYQTSYGIPKSDGMRGVPDVAYDADPASGFPIIHGGVWHTVGGTSAGAPQWAGIVALGTGVSAPRIYKDAMSKSTSYFRDITAGQNGSCGYFCTARTKYDYVTGLGSPKTSYF